MSSNPDGKTAAAVLVVDSASGAADSGVLDVVEVFVGGWLKPLSLISCLYHLAESLGVLGLSGLV